MFITEAMSKPVTKWLLGSMDLPDTAETSAFWVILQYMAMSVTTTKIDTTVVN